MVRNYKKKGTRTGEVDEQAMLKAIDEVLENKLSLRKSATKYGVNAQTLQSRIKKLRKTQDLGGEHRVFESKFASQQVFTKTEEDLLNKYILECSKMHYGLTCIQVKKLAYEFAKANKIKYPASWDNNKTAGADCAYEKTGIWPFNKLIFNDDDFAPVQVYHSNPATNPNESAGGEELGIPSDELNTVSGELCNVLARTSPNLSGDISPSLLSQHLELTVIDFDNPAPSTSNVLKTPEMIRPFPKVQRRTQTRKGRSLGKSRIYTDTPEKTRIEELEKIKEVKRLEKERKSKARELKRALSLLNEDYDRSSKPKRNKTKELETVSSDSETNISLRESSASPFDVFEENEEEDDHQEPVDPENVKDGAYVLVKFEKKKSVIYYVGQIIKHYSLTEVMVSFLRKKPGSSMKFVFPDVKDES
ncbi:unnamed protein product [Arctia plantaginis]|uniref:HTH psq-type domain-containing protein n=1 Tax=Arctia plantaginis TaxID=874455 RepID=A0A8S0ZB08_ARCPL|nr:unnamed protein product [Arctia plantaginis]